MCPSIQAEEIDFDRYLDLVFASPNRMAACTSMLAAFLETVDTSGLPAPAHRSRSWTSGPES